MINAVRSWNGGIILLLVGLGFAFALAFASVVVAAEIEGMGLLAFLPFLGTSALASVWSWNQDRVRTWSAWRFALPTLLLVLFTLFAWGFTASFGLFVLALGGVPLGLLIWSRLAHEAP